MTAKKWLLAFVCVALACALLVALFNVLTDPFGVFGDRAMDWYSYDMTMNPRTAKLSYLDEHFAEYDSYLLGCSSTSSYPVQTLNEAFDAHFYNLFSYGADMLDTEQTARYVLENYTVKNIVLNVYIENANTYDVQANALTDDLPPAVDGNAALPFYLRYLFADPAYGVEKLKSRRADTYLQQSFDVFDVETGAYDKSRRDAEPIGDTASYLQAYPEFVDYPEYTFSLPQITACVESVGRIARLCEEKGVRLTVLMSPVYYRYLRYFPQEQVREFYTALANTVDFWDFSYSSVSFEPRYFYDRTHLRNAVGNMAIARMCGDESVYVPADFGTLVTAENVASYMDTFFDAQPAEQTLYTAQVPILMYHHLDENADGNDMIVTPEHFDAQIRALTEAGYTAVSLEELYDYVRYGAALPEKPVVITFDDGYRSNYDYAYPILQKYNQKATIFAIGVSFGCSTYKDTGASITPHFGAAEAREMADSGLISIQSHTYDMHQVAQYDGADARQGMLRADGESEAAYIAALRDDLSRSRAQLSSATGQSCDALAYPYGLTSALTDTVVAAEGIRFTFSITPGVSTLVRGLPQSLYGLRRLTVTDGTSPEELLLLCADARG